LSKTSTAQLEWDPREDVAERPVPSVKLQAAERLAAHRALRHRAAPAAEPALFAAQPGAQPAGSRIQQPDTRAARIAAAVSQRYAQSQTYRAFLEAEAERTTQQARAAAEVARRTAEAVAAAQQQLLSEMENWAPEQESSAAHIFVEAAPLPAAALTVRLYEGAGPRELARGTFGVANAVPHEMLDEDEREALDEEIAFRQSPVFEEVQPAVPITANLIEFPRQLVAPRKARPRLAEGPLREETAQPEAAGHQLRIFEVETSQISTVADTEASAPEWSSIRLGASPVKDVEAIPSYAVSGPPTVMAAAFSLRLMAAAVDGCLLLAGLLGFVTVAAYAAGQVPAGLTAALSTGGALAVLFLLYQLLFFTFAEATPGMRYARIGLCTLGDDNPTRPAIRRRLLAVLLAACPMGLGFVWAWFDEDTLGWHDRISRMYQRAY